MRLASVMFFAIGTVFGVSYSMTKISIVDWIHTVWYLKLLRSLLVAGVAIGMYAAFSMIDQADWLLRNLVPDLIISFLCFGPCALLTV